MICHKHKVIYIHPRKTAGISVNKAFLDGSGEKWNYDLEDGPLSRDWRTRPKDYFIFATVRNPWDRFISGWHHLAKYRKIQDIHQLLLDLPSKYDSWRGSPERNAYQHMVQPQLASMVENGVLIPKFIIRFENLEEDYRELCSIIGKPYQKLEHLNRSPLPNKKSYWEYYDDEAVEIVYNIFKEDVEYFGYKFPGRKKKKKVHPIYWSPNMLARGFLPKNFQLQ
jgi:hypothetical protein